MTEVLNWRHAGLGLLLSLALALSLSSVSRADTYLASNWTLHSNEVSTKVHGLVTSSGRAFFQEFRWITDNAHSTRVSMNWCSNYANYSSRDFDAHDTAYRGVGLWDQDFCFALRGRSLYGGQSGLSGNLLY